MEFRLVLNSNTSAVHRPLTKPLVMDFLRNKPRQDGLVCNSLLSFVSPNFLVGRLLVGPLGGCHAGLRSPRYERAVLNGPVVHGRPERLLLLQGIGVLQVP